MSIREDILSLAVPAGWKLVPTEANVAMYKKAYPWFGSHFINFKEMYRDLLAAAPTPPAAEAPEDDWREDPSSDERWNAGLEFHALQLCVALGVDPKKVSWDAATEELEGDVRSVIGNILTTAMGESWMDRPAAEAPGQEPVAVPEFLSIARYKLTALQAAGWRVNGYSLIKEDRRGFIDHGGFVGWWLPEHYPQHTAAPPTYADAEAKGETDRLIDCLTDGEGDTVTFCSPNADFNGLPNECVMVKGGWTDWQDRAFRADTRRQCLLDAVAAIRSLASPAPKGEM